MTTSTESLPDLSDVKGIKTQAKLIYKVLAGGGERSLAALRRIFEHQGIYCLETSISACIRELNAYFRNNNMPLRIVHRHEKPGSYNTLYRIAAK